MLIAESAAFYETTILPRSKSENHSGAYVMDLRTVWISGHAICIVFCLKSS